MIGRRLGANIIDLGLDAFRGVAVGEVPVGHPRGHVPRCPRAAALEHFRLAQRLGFQGVVVEAVEVAFEGEVVLGPDALKGANELFGAAIALVMFQPGLTNGLELTLEPAADDIYRDAAVGELVDGRQLLGRQGRLPRARQDRRDHLEFSGGCQQGVAECHGLMLVIGAVAGGEADLGQAVFEAGSFGKLRQFAVVVDAPVGALLDLADHQPTADVGYPIGKFNGLLTHRTVPRAKGMYPGLEQQACQPAANARAVGVA